MNYTLKSILGEGGMAVVHLAEDHKFHTEVALKMLKKEFVSNENIKKRFLAEARSMFRMSHPHVIRVSDLIDEGDTVAFVMEYVEGETLKEYLERKGKLTDTEIKDIFLQMLDAVGYVHEQQLVHRDIKPSNFMIDKNGKVKLMDFGIAKTLDTTAAEYTLTGTGMQLGTPMYMSPEQITETKSVTAQSDIYSLGVVLWQMVTGKKPYDMKTLSNFQLQLKIVQEPLEVTHTDWDRLIQKATAKDVLNRYKSSSELKQEVLAPSTAKVEDSDSTQIDIKGIEEIKVENSTEKPQIKSNAVPEKSIPIGAGTQKVNSNSALYIGIFLSFIIGVLILFLVTSNDESSGVDFVVHDSIAVADSIANLEAALAAAAYEQAVQDTIKMIKEAGLAEFKEERTTNKMNNKEDGFSNLGSNYVLRDPNVAKDVANVFYNSNFTLFDFYTDEPIFPDKNGVYQIYYASNEDRTPRSISATVAELENFYYYKFKNYQNCFNWCFKK
jgi:serine/threonine protein kinase